MNSAPAAPAAPSAAIGGLWEFLAPGNTEQAVFWPPDVFALVGAVLERTGGYTYAVSSHWPPVEFRGEDPAAWADYVRKIGERWRTAVAQVGPEQKLEQMPEEILAWWSELLEQAEKVTLQKLEESLQDAFSGTSACRVTEMMLKLWAAADEACAGAGLPYHAEEFSDDPAYLTFLREAHERLVDRQSGEPASLCRYVTSGEVLVLPKLHTPQCGVTLRSLSHHLAFTSMREVVPVWTPLPWRFDIAERSKGKGAAVVMPHSLNLLLLPWPETVLPSDFSPASKDVGNPPHQRFNYMPITTPTSAELLRRSIDEAERIVGTVDGVVLPELALKDETGARKLAAVASKKNPSRIFITGIGGREDARGFGVNKAVVFAGNGGSEFVQEKHHRWQLDRGQIEQYGLGGRLDPAMSWWENTRIGRRHIGFLPVRPWLTMTVLICEDLARQEPVAEVVRAVGPNLVIALLMDGPQLAARWPARYATVLAEDPGSSVLTLTSIGMTKLCRPAGVKPSRVIGLWKDRNRSPIEIELPEGATGVVLSLTRQSQRERSLDHRDNAGGRFGLYLGGAHPVFLASHQEKPAVRTLTKPVRRL